MKIPVEISARHVHLSQKDFEKLFGRGKSLVSVKQLSQPEEFASEEKITLTNKDRIIENVRILGPFRKSSQAEIALTDAYILNFLPLPQIRVSGNVSGAKEIWVKNLSNQIKIPCIIAQRHLHCSVEEAKKLKLKNNQKISVKIKGIRETTFHNVVVRVSEKYRLSLHLDTDEGNAAGVQGKGFCEIV